MAEKINIDIDKEGKITVGVEKKSLIGSLLANKKNIKVKLGGAEKTAKVKLT